MNRKEYKSILCIRADNMGDVIMSTPAFRALKQTFNCRITLLTSKMGSLITPFIKEIDETLTTELPWVKTNDSINSANCFDLIERLKTCRFDAAIIFTVYSQNPLPSALIAYMADIPLRLAYCRENPYKLLTHWIPDKEPYAFIQHQVKRDLQLVSYIGAETNDEHLSISFNERAFYSAIKKLNATGFNASEKWIIAHAGVSEAKREYPEELWVKTINMICYETGMQVLLTGTNSERSLVQNIQQATGKDVFAAAGLLTIEEFIAVIAYSELVISVNTATIHIAAALNKPVITLYAQTNPQHTPWLTRNIVLPFSVPEKLRSKNQVIEFVNHSYFMNDIKYPSPEKIASHVYKFIKKTAV